MCTPGLFGGKPKVAAPAPAPVMAPPPAPVATESQKNPQDKDRLSRLRYGMAETIKTGGRGLSGGGAELTGAIPGKQKLGM